VNDRIDMPPFEMVRVVTAGELVSIYLLRWESQDSWRETIFSKTPARE
jgi:hypothetical protein